MLLIFFFFTLIVSGFLFNHREGVSNLLIFLLLTFVVFLVLMHVYCVKPESTPTDLQTDKSKRIKKKRELERAFDAILNKNTSSTD